MEVGQLLCPVEMLNSVMMPAVLIRPIRFASASVNHMWPSDPAAIPATGDNDNWGGNSVITCALAIPETLTTSTASVAA